MSEKIIGLITSNQLGSLGGKQYGFIGLETDDKKHLKVKVAAFTTYDTLDIGEHVQVTAEPLGKIWTAKKIERV